MKGKGEQDKLAGLIIRYLLLVLISISGFQIFYSFFKPLTVYPVFWFLDIFFEVSLISPTILLMGESLIIEFVPACIAGAAYFLLLMLNFSTPNIKMKKRTLILVSSFLILLIVNILRIVILATMAFLKSSLFDVTHLFFWYFLSTVFVIVIWFWEVKHYKIKAIPFYSDLKFLYKSSLKK